MPSTPVDPHAPFFIVLNAASGSDDADVARQTIERVLTEAGRRYQVHQVDDPVQLPAVARQAVQDAREAGGVVVVAGGDGTINAVAQATLGSGCALGVLPQGTFNYFSRAHGIPADTTEATRLLLTARAHRVQVGLVNERLFLVNASMGLYPELLEDREAKKKQFGRSRLVALWAALGTLLREHRPLRLRVASEDAAWSLRTPNLFVGNNRLQLEQVGIADAGAVARGQLVAVALKPTGALKRVWLMVRGAWGALGSAPEVENFAFHSISVSPQAWRRRKAKVAIDGEIVWLVPPIEFRVAPQWLDLLKPESESDPLEGAASA